MMLAEGPDETLFQNINSIKGRFCSFFVAAQCLIHGAE